MNKLPPSYDHDKAEWVKWLATYGAEKFYDSFMRNSQDAESKCVHCRERIFLDIWEGGGVPDWRTAEGDYGCFESPESTEDGCGSHYPFKG